MHEESQEGEKDDKRRRRRYSFVLLLCSCYLRTIWKIANHSKSNSTRFQLPISPNCAHWRRQLLTHRFSFVPWQSIVRRKGKERKACCWYLGKEVILAMETLFASAPFQYDKEKGCIGSTCGFILSKFTYIIIFWLLLWPVSLACGKIGYTTPMPMYSYVRKVLYLRTVGKVVYCTT